MTRLNPVWRHTQSHNGVYGKLTNNVSNELHHLFILLIFDLSFEVCLDFKEVKVCQEKRRFDMTEKVGDKTHLKQIFNALGQNYGS